MNVPVVKEWIDNLRSGKYQQGTGYLRTDGGPYADQFCCLGVLCDMYDKSKWRNGGAASKEGTGVMSYIDGTLVSLEMPPPSVLEWAGVPGGLASDLAECNDSGETFAELADMIEVQLKKQPPLED